MSNFATQIQDPDQNYNNYTSNIYRCNSRSDSLRGVIQVEIVTGTATIEGRLTSEAPWFSITSYSESAMEEIVMPSEIRSVFTGEGRVWIKEIL